MGAALLTAVGTVVAQIRFGPDTVAPGERLDGIVAVLDNDVITRAELDRSLAEVQRQLQTRGVTMPPREVLERQVLERLIIDRLQDRAAARLGVVIDDPSLDAAVESVARQNNLTLSQLRDALQRDGVSFTEFREDIRQQLRAQRLRQQVVDTRLSVTEQEVDNALNRIDLGVGSREYRLAQILITIPQGASSAQLEQAQNRVRQVYAELERGVDFQRLAVAASAGREALDGGELGWFTAARLPAIFGQIVPQLSPGEVSPPIRSPQGVHILKLLETRGDAVSTQPVTQRRVRHILIGDSDDAAARAQLERLRQRILAGEDFASLARANSTDPSAAAGGELGWLGPDEPDRQFFGAIAGLNPGETSMPFQTAAGWHIAQVQERRQQVAADTSQRAAVREALLRRKAEEEWDLWLRQQRDQAYVEIRL